VPKLVCAEVNEISQNLCRSSCAEVKPCRSSITRSISGLFDNTYPKFRFTGTAPSGDIAPVVWSNQQINVDPVINGGIFLCLRPGYYYFTAAMSTREDQTVEIFLNLNSREIVKDT